MAMNPWDGFRLWLARGLVKTAGLPIVPPWVTASFIEPLFRNLVREGYKQNSVVFACISALAFHYPEPPLVVTDADNNLLPNSPLQKLLNAPNPLMGGRELALYTIAYKAIGGNSYWYKVRSAAGRVVELWPYHAGQMKPVPGGDQWILRYDYDPYGTGQTIPVAVNDVVHFKWPSPDPEQPWQALPPLRGAAREVDSDNEMTRYLFALLKNDAVPRTALIIPQGVTLSDPQWNRLQKQWNERFGGENRGSTAIVEGGADIKRIGLDLKELAFDALHALPEKRIAAAFRVPLSVAGIGEDPTYSNSETAYKRFAEGTLGPMWALDAGEVQANLANEFGENVLVRYDLSQVKALRENENELWARTNTAIATGWVMVNEGRTRVGLPRVKNGDVFLRGLAVEAEEGQVVKAKAGALETKASNPRRAALKLAQSLQRIRRDTAKRMTSTVEDFFEGLAKRVVERAEKAAWPRRGEAKQLPKVNELLTPGDENELGDIVKRFYVEIASSSWETWNIALGVEAAFDLNDPAVTTTLAEAGKHVKNITASTKDSIVELLKFGNEHGWSIDDLVSGDAEHDGLRKLVAETYKDRARTIARTELGEAQQKTASARYKANGVKSVLVLDNGFDDSDPVCQELGQGGEGTVKSLEWAEENPLQHPNCVRAFVPWFDD